MNSQLQNSVERWLVQENYEFKELKSNENNFQYNIKNLGSYKITVEIFEPKKQLGVIVIGGQIFLQNRQTARYLKLTELEQQKFKSDVKLFCDSIHAIHKIFREDGKVTVKVYVVLDKVDILKQVILDSINQVVEMSEKTHRFIMKTF